jgi:tRNA nucleotidyltransferase/poly(A) polymerase
VNDDAASLLARLAPSLGERLAAAAGLARRMGVALYLVGGSVRDLVQGRESPDLDLVVEGDGLAFAARLAAELGGTLRTHEGFLTAVVFDRAGLALDVATARSEIYRAPAALPEVQPGTLAADLLRRDFTVNTLAIDLGARPPVLVDLHGGRRDLERGVLRVLHDGSFVDDPTRVLRGVRLERRLGLRLDAEAERLARAAVAQGVFARLSGGRLRDELARLLDEPAVGLPGVERLAGLGLLAVLHPRLALDERTRGRIQAALGALDELGQLEGFTPAALEAGAPESGSGDPATGGRRVGKSGRAPGIASAKRWRVILMALIADLAAGEREEAADRLLLAGDERRLIVGFPDRLATARRGLHREAAPHQAAEALRPLAAEELAVLVAEDEQQKLAAAEAAAARGAGAAAKAAGAARTGGEGEAAAWVRRYLNELSRCELTVRGADLLAAGATAGPAIGEALRAAWRARVDGEISAAGELPFALDWLRQNGAKRSGGDP